MSSASGRQGSGGRPITATFFALARVPALAARLAWATTGAALALFLITLARVPIPWADEIWMASASYSIAQGGNGVPSALPPGPWYAPFPHVYGPVFFYLSAILIRLFGLSPVSVRLACVLGAGLLAVSSALLVRAAGGGARWSALAGTLVALTPELGTIATNGRMDGLAIAMEIAGMAAVVAAARAADRQSCRAYAAAAGGFCLLAVLTSVRALPLLGGLGLGSLWFLVDRRRRRNVATAGACAAAIFAAGGLLWLHHMGVTPVAWTLTYLRSSRGDAQNVLLAGEARIWGLDLRNTITPAVIIGAAGVLAWLRAARPSNRTGEDRVLPPAVVALLVAGVVNVAFIFTVANHVFTSSSYFVLPLFAAVLTATVILGQNTGRSQVVLTFWLAGAALFGAVRIVKYVEVWQTWPYRDPAPLQGFVERSVPPRSLVFGYDQYYFYAVQNAGSTFRSWTPTPFPPPAFGKPAGISVEGEPSPALANRRFLLWPADGLPGPVPAAFACATAHAVGRFSVSDARPTGIERFGGFVPALHGYPDTVLYRLPADCHP